MKVFKLRARDYIDPKSGEPRQGVKMIDAGGMPKCGGCNWEVSYVFVAAASRRDAEFMYRTGRAGMCGDCFSEMLEEISAQVISPKLRPASETPELPQLVIEESKCGLCLKPFKRDDQLRVTIGGAVTGFERPSITIARRTDVETHLVLDARHDKCPD